MGWLLIILGLIVTGVTPSNGELAMQLLVYISAL